MILVAFFAFFLTMFLASFNVPLERKDTIPLLRIFYTPISLNSYTYDVGGKTHFVPNDKHIDKSEQRQQIR